MLYRRSRLDTTSCGVGEKERKLDCELKMCRRNTCHLPSARLESC